MLTALSIRDVVLIEALDLDFHAGLGVLTGETGAGKSILLDALGLALGARGDSALVRAGAAQAVVTASFDPPADSDALALLADNGQQYAFVTGPEVAFDPAVHDLGTTALDVLIDGVAQERAYGSAVMESSPLTTVVWLANKLAAFGRALEPGDVVMTGSFTRQYKLDRPMHVEARFAPFGSAVATFV